MSSSSSSGGSTSPATESASKMAALPMVNGEHQASSVKVVPFEDHEHQCQQVNGHLDTECVGEERPSPGADPLGRKGSLEGPQGQEGSRMASVIVINGTEQSGDPEEDQIGGGRGRGGCSTVQGAGCFDNPGFEEDEANGGGTGGSETPTRSATPPPMQARHAFVDSSPATPSEAVNGLATMVDTPSSNMHSSSGLIMTPSEKEKKADQLDGGADVAEAVNLELVNMNPYGDLGVGGGDPDIGSGGGKSGTNGGLNGIPVKRGAGDEETGDGGFGDPYDEYFVPVNEHRKYIRGEKLYVTKDRRRSQSWRRCICWGVGFTLLAVAILIAVLAGTGVILSQEPEDGAVEGRAFGSSIPRVAESKDHSSPVEKEEPPLMTTLPVEPSSSFTPPPSMSSVPGAPPTTEMSGLYVPRVLEAEMTIDSLDYMSDLANSSSTHFRRLAVDLETELRSTLIDHHTVMNGPADVFIKITGFRPGSVVSMFHVGWRYKESFSPPNDPIDADSLKDRLEAHLLKNGGFLYTYHVSSGSVKANSLIDLCQIDNGGCSHECRYDYQEAKFMCNCPPGLYLDQSEKKCSSELMDNIMTSSEGPKFDDGPWMPIETEEEPVFTAEVANPSEGSQEVSEGEETLHQEMNHHHDDNDSHAYHSAEDSGEKQAKHEDEMTTAPLSITESGFGVDGVMSVERHAHHDVSKVVQHGVEHEGALGTERSGGEAEGVAILSTHSSGEEEVTGEEGLMKTVEDDKADESMPTSKEEMGHLGVAVDSSENTSEEEQESGERSENGSSIASMDGGNEDYSPKKSHGYHHIAFPIDETVSSESLNEKSQESIEHIGFHHDGMESDSNASFSGTGHESDSRPLKGQIVSAVEHLGVMDEDKSSEGTEGKGQGMKGEHENGMESSSGGHRGLDGDGNSLGEVEAHVATEGEGSSGVEMGGGGEGTLGEGWEAVGGGVQHVGVGHVDVMVVGGEDGQEDGKEEEDEGAKRGGQAPDGVGSQGRAGGGEVIPAVQDVHYVINHGKDQSAEEGKESNEEEESEVSVGHVTEAVLGEDEKKTDLKLMNHERSKVDEGKGMEVDSKEHSMDETVIATTALVDTFVEGEVGGEMEEVTTVGTMGNDAEMNRESLGKESVLSMAVGDGFIVNPEIKDRGMEQEKGTEFTEEAPNGSDEVKGSPTADTTVNKTEGSQGAVSTLMAANVIVSVDEKTHSPLGLNTSEEGVTTEGEEGNKSRTLLLHTVNNQVNALEGGEGMADNIEANGKDSERQPAVHVPNEEASQNDVIESTIPEERLESEDEDPNIVPVEETPKEAIIDHLESKKLAVVPEIDVRLGDSDEKVLKNDMEMTTVKENPVDMQFMSAAIDSSGSHVQENNSRSVVEHDMEMFDVALLSSTPTPSENSIENLSDHFNSTDSASHFPPTAENDLSAIPSNFAIPLDANNDTSVSPAVQPVKDNGNSDSLLQSQADDPHLVSSQPSSTESTTEAVGTTIVSSGTTLESGNFSSLEGHGVENVKDRRTDQEEHIKKLISDTTAKLEAEIRMISAQPIVTSTEAFTLVKKDNEMEEVKDKKEGESKAEVAGGANVMNNEEEKLVEEEPLPENEEESFSTIHQDFTEEHANTVYAMTPTSPSTVAEEPVPGDVVSDTPILVPLGSSPQDGATVKEAEAVAKPNSHISLESDDGEQSNNLAALNNEDLLATLGGRKNPLGRVGTVDVALKPTTEHTNEILVASMDHKNWPATALETRNVTEGISISSVAVEGHQSGTKEPKSSSHTKIDTYEIPLKKKGEFKKPIHHEDEISKAFFVKDSKESLNKVDKIGLLPPSLPTVKEARMPDMVSEEEVDSLVAMTTKMPNMADHSLEVVTTSSTTEAILTPLLSLVDKGGERLNAIAENDTGNRKDLGKPVTKDGIKEMEEGMTVKPELLNSDGGMAKEVIGYVMKEEGATGHVKPPSDQQGDTMANETSIMEESGLAFTDVTEGDAEKEEEGTPRVTVAMDTHPTHEPGREEVTTVSPNVEMPPEESDNKASNIGKPTENVEEDTTVANEVESTTVAMMTVKMDVHRNVEEMLKEMGGFGEGAHKVVAKTGVEEPLPGASIEGTTVEANRATALDVTTLASTASISMFSSVTTISSTSSETISEELIVPTPHPEGENKAVELDVSTEWGESVLHHNDGSKNDTKSTSEDPIPTLMVHEVVTETAHASSSVQAEDLMEDDTTTVTNGGPKVNVSMDTLESHPVTVPPEPSDSEILVKEETSNIAGEGKVKEVVVTTANEVALEANETDSGLNVHNREKNHIERVDGIANTATSTLPQLDQQFFSKCTAGQFQCTNGTSLTPYSVMPISSSSVTSLATGVACVPLSAKCDSINDCSDGSDELGCIEEGCPGNFQCTNGQCLKRHLVCNGIVDCNDGSDEASCDKWQCQFDELQCPSGRCIPILWQCDGKPDCANHTDEHNCQDSCGNDEYLCPERWCIPMSWRCNGVPECANGEDEKLCDCSLEQVKCGTGGCVARTEICDGVEQCPDQSDEWNCVQLHNETMKLEVRTSENEWLPVCADRWDNSWSNFICQSFGYSRSVFTEYPTLGELNGSSDVFMLKPGISSSSQLGSGMRLPGMLQRASSSLCSSGSIVEISCQEFTCGNHGLADGVAARLVGGDEAANGQWPSVALLYHTRQRATCTASIISPRWLIASYNCLHMREKSLSPDGWVAFGGGSTFDKDKPETQIRTIRSIVPYPQVKYNRFLYNHDVALVELIEPLTFTWSVGAICLPEKAIEPRQLCVTAGWGYTSPGEINFSQYLHYLPVPTIDLHECNSTKHYSGFITEDKICAGFTDAMRSPCYNDDGAPLMCVSEGGIWELQGVLSYHSNCGRGYHPSIFSSVTAVKDWVRRVVGGRFERRSTFNVRRRRRGRRRRALIVWT